MHQDIANRLIDISSKIQAACLQGQRSVDEVKLVAVSKLQSVDVIKEAYALGINNFGENYAQELAEKSSTCPNDIVWHFIGPIQSNKVSLIAKYAQWVHSIDREKVAMKLNNALESEGKKIHALIQVNIDHEESKSGILPEETIDFANKVIACYPNLILEGLMFMPKINASKKAKIETMNKIVHLHKALLSELPSCSQLSLGTSSDFEESILQGSTILRIGESLLGKRS
ncbi:YggS family pyridoxal phosphate-dependent enzyme [Gammaproteobacteria bacterium]|jgi:pyridoxal phosphate enzyme (YggS family)|nr:YggS family pyridoxal phosphate-dependent enzyme [SAR86 cluster bacterium]MDA9140551.1 YggS family pyridoxal phosphate-dependent enzyme [Gammaproteobacteria bacterium]MDB2339601.1 YggS family pyridoxal phosphate-dependent enzyme [Gammaproteobacteria bacterium]MDB3881409.1 YggS family pyridoxal phosphate-dependent enzyme [Gammaproteobacteria bacterium]MDC0512583.1 YggS family pyridoxal phosphate-dependent enzyme [Gammaproteobacteria bacterium]